MSSSLGPFGTFHSARISNLCSGLSFQLMPISKKKKKQKRKRPADDSPDVWNSSQFILGLAGSEPSDIHISQVHNWFLVLLFSSSLCLQGCGSELCLVHPMLASEASDTAPPARHQLILYPQCCSNPNPRRTTAVLIFHVGLITQFYDNDNVLQIATRQLIQWTWISGQLAVVLESFNHHVISHLFNLNTHTHTHTQMWFVVWV